MAKQLGEMATERGRVVTLVIAIKDGQVNSTERRVTRTLLLIPEKEEDSPGLILDSEVKRGTRTGSFSNANSPPRAMGTFAEDDG